MTKIILTQRSTGGRCTLTYAARLTPTQAGAAVRRWLEGRGVTRMTECLADLRAEVTVE